MTTIDGHGNRLRLPLSSIPPSTDMTTTTTTNDVIGGMGNKRRSIIDVEKRQRLPLSPVLSSLFLSSIREEEGDDEDKDEEDTDVDPNDPRRHHRVMHAVVDTTMQVMDYLEDEIDTNTWNKLDDFVPMQLRLAIEDQVFGWDHFLSSILGHVGYTLASYVMTYWLVTFVVLRRVPWGGVSVDHRGEDYRNADLRPWGMPYELFAFLRTVLSIGFAISTFRTIRRRRRVWLPRHAAFSSSTAAAGRFTFHEADRQSRRFVLGTELWNKLRRSYAKRRDRMLAQNRVRVLGGGGVVAPVGGGEGARKRFHSDTSNGAVDDGCVEDETDDSMGGGSSIGDKDVLAHRGGRNRGDRFQMLDSHTLPNFAMESVCHDQMPFAYGKIKRVPYVHGGFFGAAPFMLTNPHWIGILRRLMPDVYVEISRRAAYAPAPKLIHWAENNPVVAAYGTAHELEFSGKVPTLEWDVFLDPYLVRRVEIVLSEKESFVRRQKNARQGKILQNYSESTGENNDAIDLDETKRLVPLEEKAMEGGRISNMSNSTKNSEPVINASDERLVISYYDEEIKRRTAILVERMLIAHGNMVQIAMEQISEKTGYLKRYNFSRVKRTRKTLGGGIFARQWLAIYSEAMKLGVGHDDDDSDCWDDTSLEDLDEFADSPNINGDGDSKNHVPANGEPRWGNTSLDSKSAAATPNSLDMASLSVTRTPLDQTVESDDDDDASSGPPRKIIMIRNNAEIDEGEISTDGDCNGFINSETTSPRLKADHTIIRRRAKRASPGEKKRRSGRMTPSKANARDHLDQAATSLEMVAICPDKSMSDSISILKPILECASPFRVVLDMKSRYISRHVWALVVDYLRGAGAKVEGIASFFVEEVRDISQYCSSPINEIVFAHSAGDMQEGCHSGKIRRGDRVFFNAGSLLWDYPNVYDLEVVKNILGHRFHPFFDEQGIKEGYHFKPYAKTIQSSLASPKYNRRNYDSESETCDESTFDDGESNASDLFARLLISNTKKKSLSGTDFVFEEAPDGDCSTIQQYKDYYQLSIGLYVQEFAIDEVAISLIAKYVNLNLHVYNLGLSWGGINGLTVKGIQPGRFTATDGKSVSSQCL
ncbi:hypothetical protein ACHAXA_009677 [Cyclostephanos tholiformis]|uniref:Uncharacterized protein n=1 Tax=Cyclostephanos tholiformis TaxID=382380 RepID=A0ABD3RH50_9STRA